MHVARRLKTQRTQPILSLRPLHFSCACIAVFFLSMLHDQHALRTLRWAAWKLTFKSIFIGLHTVSKLSYATHAMQSQCMHAKKTQRKQSVLCSASLRALRFSCAHVSVFYLCHMSSVRCVAYGSLETDLKSIFIGLRAVSKLSYATHTTQRTLCNAIKNRNTQRMHAKDTTHAINSILCVFRVHTLHPLRCVRQLRNRPLSLFSAFWWRQLCFDVRHVYVNPW